MTFSRCKIAHTRTHQSCSPRTRVTSRPASCPSASRSHPSLSVSFLCSYCFHTTKLSQSHLGVQLETNTVSTLKSHILTWGKYPTARGQVPPSGLRVTAVPDPPSLLTPQGGLVKLAAAPRKRHRAEADVGTVSWASATRLCPVLQKIFISYIFTGVFSLVIFSIQNSLSENEYEEIIGSRSRCKGKYSFSFIWAKSQLRNEYFCLCGVDTICVRMTLLLCQSTFYLHKYK